MIQKFILFVYLYIAWNPNYITSIRIFVKPEIWDRYFPYTNDLNFSRDWSDECDVPCVWTGKPENVDAVFYVVKNDEEALWAMNDIKEAPISICGTTEGRHYYPHLTNEEFRKHFDGNALLATDSDIPWLSKISSYIDIQKVKSNPDPIKKAAIALFNCDSRNNREQIIKEMRTILEIDCLGRCLNNHPWPNCGDRECNKEEALRKYALCLAFENGNSPGYVTEKIHQCFRAGSLPVFYGNDAVRKYVPKGSYIEFADFPSHFALAEYLVKALNNDTLYKSYFEWKDKPLDPDFIRANKPFWDYKVYCRVCRFVLVKQKGLTWDKETQNAVENQSYETTETEPPEVPSNIIGEISVDTERITTESSKNTQPTEETTETKEQGNLYIENYIENYRQDFVFIQASLLVIIIIVIGFLIQRGFFKGLLKVILGKPSSTAGKPRQYLT